MGRPRAYPGWSVLLFGALARHYRSGARAHTELHTPGGAQAFYFGASEPLTPDTARTVDFDRIRASGATNGGIEILGPPPFAQS